MTILRFDDKTRRHAVTHHRDGASVDGTATKVRADGDGAFVATIDGRHRRLHAVAHGDVIHVQLDGRAWRLDAVDPARSIDASAGGVAAGTARAPMPGMVVSVHAALGQAVLRGDALLVIESMKLQLSIDATTSGVVSELPFAVGQTFQRGALLVRIDDEIVA